MTTAQETVQARKPLTDSDITEAVKRRLRRKMEVRADEISLIVLQGIVTLSGRARNLIEKERAVEIVESVRGVRGIVDEIEVEVPRRSDSDIAEDVRKALADDPAIPAGLVEVQVARGSVVLSGTLPSWGERRLADKAVKAVRGIRVFQDHISVVPRRTRPDAEIRKEIAELLSASVWLDERLIDLTVNDGKVTLGGCVGSVAQKARARCIARMPGVTAVDDSQLQVSPWIHDEMLRDIPYEARTPEEVLKAARDVLRYDPRVAESAITVRIENGTAILDGCVKGVAERHAAVNDVSEVVGISAVQDRLQVKPPNPGTDEQISAAIGASLLQDPVLEGFNITVSVDGGSACLEGEVRSHFAYDRAGAVAAGVPGVREVRNDLHVRIERKVETDEELRLDVEEELFWNPLVGSSGISVSVNNGIVTLTGNVCSTQEKHIATCAALTAGAHAVRNRILVPGG